MAIEDFKKVHLVAHRSIRDEVLAELQRLGVLDLAASTVLPARVPSVAGERDLETRLRRLDETLRRLGPLQPPVGLRQRLSAERPRHTEADLLALERGFDLESFLAGMDAIRTRSGELRGAAVRLDEEERRLLPWRGLDAPLDLLQPTRTVAFAAGRVRHGDLPRFRKALAVAGGVELDVGEDALHRSVVVLHLRADRQAVLEAISRAKFEPVELPVLPLTPAGRLQEIEEERRALAVAEVEVQARLEVGVGSHADLLALRDLLAGRLDRLRAERMLGETSAAVSIEGWAPTRLIETVRAAVVGRFALASFEACDPAPADRVPILLKNHAIIRPFELVVELYGLPRYGGIDPTAVLAFFFLIFFGLCLTDAGYGIFLALTTGAALLLAPSGMEQSTRRFLRFFCLGGVATIVMGALAGGWFGVTVPLRLFDPVQDLMLFFAGAMVLGALHLFAGLGLRMAHQFRRGQVLAPLLDQGLWITTITPLIALLGVKAGKVPASAQPALAFVALASALGIVFFAGRGEPREPRREWLHHLLWGGVTLALALHLLGHARPWSGGAAFLFGAVEIALLRGRVLAALGRLGLGLYSLYGISGYLGDILSYSRLVALGLGSGTVAMIVNTLAKQALAAPAVGMALAAAIFVVGHLFNLAINLLGAFVHSCRLQYVEFFTKFYESGGRPYAPFRFAPKHVTIVSEDRS